MILRSCAIEVNRQLVQACIDFSIVHLCTAYLVELGRVFPFEVGYLREGYGSFLLVVEPSSLKWNTVVAAEHHMQLYLTLMLSEQTRPAIIRTFRKVKYTDNRDVTYQTILPLS